MKLILTADVDHLGSIGDTVEVKDGYGRNFLLPRKAGGPNLDKRIVRLPKTHIKAVGTHFVSVHLHPEIDVEVSLDVVAQS